MTSSAIPVVSTLAALVELTAKLGRQNTLRDISKVLRSSVKWMLPTEYAGLVLRNDAGGFELWPEGTTVAIPYHVETVMLTRSALEPQDPKPTASMLGLPADLNALMILPLADGADNLLGVLLLGSHDPRAFAYVDRGTCHLLALSVSSSVRATQLFEREQTARKQAELAIASRNKLVSTVTHDLRNPLGVVMTLFELNVEQGVVPVEDEHDVRAALHRMRGLLDEMIDLARTESGAPQTTIKLARTRCDLVPMLTQATRVVRTQLTPLHSLYLELGTDALIGQFDEPRMVRVLENLLGNAIKYSPSGGEVRVTATRHGERARLVVRDHGLGIPAVHMPRLFERFARAPNVGSIRGTGLGLASVQEIVTAHGGSLDVASVEGDGSTFTVELPLSA